MYAYNQETKSNLYDHMREIDLQYWTIELLEARFVDKITELRQMEQKWNAKENPLYLLNMKNAIKTDKSLLDTKNKVYMIADKIVKPILDELIDEIINEISHTELTNSNESED